MSATIIASLKQELIGVKTNCKKAYEWVRDRDDKIGKTIDLLEAAYLAAPSEAMKALLLKTQQIHRRTKVIGTIEKYETNALRPELPGKWVVLSRDAEIGINDICYAGYWDAQAVRNNTKVRYFLNAAGIKMATNAMLRECEAYPMMYKNPKVHG